MKKIAIIAPYVGTINRGAETFVIELTKKLREEYIIDVYTLAIESTLKDNIKVINVKTNCIYKMHKKCFDNIELYRKIINKFYYLIPDVIFQHKFSKQAFKIINNNNYDILFPNNGIWGAKYSAKLRKKTKTPFIYTGHGGIGIGEKYIINTNPNAYICLTNKQLDWANSIKKNNYVKTCIIPNGVCVNDFITEKKIKDTINILSVAALTSFKRHELTIKAVAQLPNSNLIILGKGEEEKNLKKLADKYLPGRCTITSTTYANIKKYYANADLFVLPSMEEPFGIVYLEAMASNVPIVAPDDSQRKEIIADAGLYCNVENIQEYANCIKKALEINWGNKPLQRAKKFDWTIIAQTYDLLIKEIIRL